MSTISDEGISDEGYKKALDGYPVRLLPGPNVKSWPVAESRQWGPYVEGDWISVLVTEKSYLQPGTESAVATTSSPAIPVGQYDFAVPEGVTHVAVISSVTDAEATVWKSSKT
jgi:hypothetical protein